MGQQRLAQQTFIVSVISCSSQERQAFRHCLRQRKRRGYILHQLFHMSFVNTESRDRRLLLRHCPLLAPGHHGDQGPLRTEDCQGVAARHGYTKQISSSIPLFRRFCAGNHPRCHRHQKRFRGRNLMSPWLPLLSRPFLLYFHHLFCHGTVCNHHLQVVIWRLKC
jgi:hypothetical protein